MFATIICYLRGFVNYNNTGKYYITVVTWALMVCLIYAPEAQGPVALRLQVYISGKPRVPMLQLYSILTMENPIQFTQL